MFDSVNVLAKALNNLDSLHDIRPESLRYYKVEKYFLSQKYFLKFQLCGGCFVARWGKGVKLSQRS